MIDNRAPRPAALQSPPAPPARDRSRAGRVKVLAPLLWLLVLPLGACPGNGTAPLSKVASGGNATHLALPELAAALLRAEQTIPVVLDTDLGQITLELYPERTPGTVENFLEYVRAGHYDDTVVYRIESFLIQMGSRRPSLEEKPKRPPIENEADRGLENRRGTVGMARWGPHTADAEFYINVTDNPHLDHRDKTEAGWGYCAFAKVIDGLEVVDAIAAIPTEARPRYNLTRYPSREVRIRRVTIAGEELQAAPTPK